MRSNDHKLVAQICGNFERENKALLNTLETLIYYSRGCLSREDGFALTPFERENKVRNTFR
jgi:hypothetical protein